MSEKDKVMHGTEYKNTKDQKNFSDPHESGSGSSPDDSSNGQVEQVLCSHPSNQESCNLSMQVYSTIENATFVMKIVIKIIVILGFGVQIFLIRQKETRKKNREENVNIRHPDNADGRISTEWWLRLLFTLGSLRSLWQHKFCQVLQLWLYLLMEANCSPQFVLLT